MKLKQLFTDEDAVSPVIGVILMVAITVILAAVIGTFVLGLGDQVSESAPTASFTFDYTEGGTTPSDVCSTTFGGSTNDYLDVTHDGGDSIEAGKISLTDGDNSATWDSCAGDKGSSDLVKAGNIAHLDAVETTDTIRVVWEGSSDSATIGKWSGPDA